MELLSGRLRARRVLAGACTFAVAVLLSGCAALGERASEQVSERPPSRTDAARFLTQATFGPTEAEVERLMAIGYRAWIDDQFARPASRHRVVWESRDAAIKAADPRKAAGPNEVLHVFWKSALAGEDQLRQRVAYALSQIFVVSMADGSVRENPRGVAAYLDLLADKGLGNYRELIEAVSRHPVMGAYLSHLRNQKEDPRTGRVPDQNYAREVMQLFSIGLHELNPDGSLRLEAGRPIDTYDADDVLGLSRVFTGFSWDGPDKDNNRFHGNAQDFQDAERNWRPMQGYTQYHSRLEKRFLGTVVSEQARADPDASLAAAMETLYRHPNVGPFIGRQLIQRLVTSNPSPAYVARAAAAFDGDGRGVRGDMKAVIHAVLLDPEARDPDRAKDGRFGKLREPVLRLSAFLRAFGVRSDSGDFLLDATDDPGTQLGQSPLRAPSVFNFYRPGYVPPGTRAAAAGLVAPEMQITHETSVAGYVNFMREAVASGVGRRGGEGPRRRDLQPDYAPELALAAQPAALVDRMDRLLTGGQMSAALKAEIGAALASLPVPAARPDGSNAAAVERAKRTRVQAALLLTLASPEFIVQK
ncbi:DUF1800 domain-containing protein [Caldimonas tepidiphila]|uniref:DUF1800 domain-containing protein n=1 Tax=Caldimonas tepidiphila TaxID=2315841 RepID=UPI000E5A28CB|nr:DUF1800 family protein [Caldimonas tepidiphila]